MSSRLQIFFQQLPSPHLACSKALPSPVPFAHQMGYTTLRTSPFVLHPCRLVQPEVRGRLQSSRKHGSVSSCPSPSSLVIHNIALDSSLASPFPSAPSGLDRQNSFVQTLVIYSLLPAVCFVPPLPYSAHLRPSSGSPHSSHSHPHHTLGRATAQNNSRYTRVVQTCTQYRVGWEPAAASRRRVLGCPGAAQRSCWDHLHPFQLGGDENP